jgi:hypothetical protein
MPQRIFGSKKDKIPEKWRKLSKKFSIYTLHLG